MTAISVCTQHFLAFVRLYVCILMRNDKKNRKEKWLKTLLKFCYRTWRKRIFESHDKVFFSIGSNPVGVSYLMTRHITLLSARNTISYFFTASIFQIKTYYMTLFFSFADSQKNNTWHVISYINGHHRQLSLVELVWTGLSRFKLDVAN